MNIKRILVAPVNGSNELQTITTAGTITGGTFTLTINGLTTAPIAWNATNATLIANVQAALDAMLGSTNTLVAVGTMTAGIGTLTVTFQNALGMLAQQGAFTASAALLTGAGAAVTAVRTTPGVTATFRDSPNGQLLCNANVTPAVLYQNASTTTLAPNWVVLGATVAANNASSGAIPIPSGQSARYVITYNGGVGGYTLAAPTAITDDGKVLVIVNAAPRAHVITGGVDGFNAKGSSGTITFGAAIGNAVTLLAYNGHWYTTASINATVA